MNKAAGNSSKNFTVSSASSVPIYQNVASSKIAAPSNVSASIYNSMKGIMSTSTVGALATSQSRFFTEMSVPLSVEATVTSSTRIDTSPTRVPTTTVNIPLSLAELETIAPQPPRPSRDNPRSSLNPPTVPRAGSISPSTASVFVFSPVDVDAKTTVVNWNPFVIN